MGILFLVLGVWTSTSFSSFNCTILDNHKISTAFTHHCSNNDETGGQNFPFDCHKNINHCHGPCLKHYNYSTSLYVFLKNTEKPSLEDMHAPSPPNLRGIRKPPKTT